MAGTREQMPGRTGKPGRPLQNKKHRKCDVVR